jgi:hypothetical protein
MNDRIERLKSDAAELNVGKGAARDGVYQTLGAVAMVAGVVVALMAYVGSRSLDDTRDIQSTIVLALAMLALSIAGAAVFVRYSLARFLRFWLLRQLYEGQAHIDQVVEAIGGRPAGGDPDGDPGPAATDSSSPGVGSTGELV